MRIIERDNRSAERKQASERERDDLLMRLGRAERQVRTLLTRNQVAWDQGFACAIDMFARGATLDDMRERVRRPQEVPVLARVTTRELESTTEDVDTAPIA